MMLSPLKLDGSLGWQAVWLLRAKSLAEARGQSRLEVNRGDVVVSSSPGAFGKPRPALVE